MVRRKDRYNVKAARPCQLLMLLLTEAWVWNNTSMGGRGAQTQGTLDAPRKKKKKCGTCAPARKKKKCPRVVGVYYLSAQHMSREHTRKENSVSVESEEIERNIRCQISSAHLVGISPRRRQHSSQRVQGVTRCRGHHAPRYSGA